MNSKVRNQATISKKRQNNDLPSSAFCFSQLKMSFCKTVFLRCSFALKTERTAFFFLWIIIWNWFWNKTLALKPLLWGHRIASNTGRAEDVRFQNQAALAATTI